MWRPMGRESIPLGPKYGSRHANAAGIGILQLANRDFCLGPRGYKNLSQLVPRFNCYKYLEKD